MSDQNEIINRVASSSLITLDLEEYYHQGERLVYDLRQNLVDDLILKEKPFREFISSNDWSVYTGKNVAIQCTADAIVPTWAYMLVASRVSSYAHMVVYGSLDNLEQALFQQALQNINIERFRNAKVVIKGCSKYPVPPFAYVELTRLLTPVVSSLMYGEPCSTVPIYKKK